MRKVEHRSFSGDSYAGVLENLNEYLNHPPFRHRKLVSVQETNTGNKLATETTYTWWGTYLIAWEDRR